MKTLVFKATDTWFFRESRPMEAQGELQSVFPPPMRTLTGAIRSLIGEHMGVNWSLFKDKPSDEKCQQLRQVIGFADDLGRLKFKGAWLMKNQERLYPAPLHLMQKDEILYNLALDQKAVCCDLGENVRLAKLPNGIQGAKPLENTWLTLAEIQKVLKGDLPDSKQLRKAQKLFTHESRLGIARDYQTRAVREGLLYQTRHIRPESDVAIAIDVEGLPDDFPPQAMLRLGAEGRTAAMQLVSKQAAVLEPPSAKMIGEEGKFALYLLTPLHRGNAPKEQLLPDFEKVEAPEMTYWRGKISGVPLKLYGAITGKMQREGGWDLANHCPRAVANLIPAGSVFFCQLAEPIMPIAEALKKLHLEHHGAMTDYGYGQFAVGIWKD